MARAIHPKGAGPSARERTVVSPHDAATGRRDRLLVALTFSSGAVDAISVVALGKVFTAFMTGNLVFLALGATGADTREITPVLLSLVAFSAGVSTAQWMVGDVDGREVWPGVVSGVLRLAAVGQAAFLVVWIATSGHPAPGAMDVLLVLSAMAMGLQSGAVRALGVPGVFTTAATATVIGLMSELANRRRPPDLARLTMVLVGLVAGAAAGGLLLIHLRRYAAVLPLAMTLLVMGRASRGGLAQRHDLDEVGQSRSSSAQTSSPLPPGDRLG
jgi:uncharacterized membrane protein YoaK (UPF0700 family)